jgi:ubiquinone/menaquinone biosynthesis C-methylase UbiE
MKKAWQDPKLANVVYHDWEAETYDHKWSVDYDERCMEYVSDRFALIAGRDGWPYGDALEVGCGTGFFSLNLKGAGVIDRVHVTDLSSKMVETAKRNGEALGFEVEGRVADAERLPYDDDTFDLVIGHAMLHHIPDVELALRECLRVLKPGGRFVFAGEPTVIGDWVARRLGRITWIATTKLTRLPGLRHLGRSEKELAAQAEEAHLEWVVDLHTFDPKKLRRMAVAAGAADAKVATEQLTAAWFGWPVRTIEAAIPRERLGVRWAFFAYRTWQRLSIFDEKVASRILPKAVFYNVLVTGTKPVHASSTRSNEQPQAAGRR